MRGAKVNKTKEKHAECEHMSCLQQNEGEHVCVWAHACLHGTILVVKEGRGGSRGRRGRITHCGERTKKCECARCYPMRRRSSDKRYVAYSVTLKRDEKTLMNRHVMSDKQHNTTTILDQTMTKPFNVVNTKPALCFIIWEPPHSSQRQALLLRTKASPVTKQAVDS